MANAKIISIIDHEVAAAMRLTAGDIEATRDKVQHDIAFVAANLRHDINALAAAVNTLRQDLTSLKDELRQASLDQLKQGGGTPEISA